MTAFQAWLVFGESFDGYGVVGFLLAAVAVYLVTRKPRLPLGRARVAARAES